MNTSISENAWSSDDKTGKLIVTASGTNFKKMLGVEMTGKKTDRRGEAGDARAGATKPSPPNQPWVRNDDKNKVVIGRLAWFVGRLRGCPLSCVIEWTLFSFYERGIASRIAKASPLGSR